MININDVKFISINGDLVYIGVIVPVIRGIKNKGISVVDELLIFGFNKRLNYDLYLKYKYLLEEYKNGNFKKENN